MIETNTNPIDDRITSLILPMPEFKKLRLRKISSMITCTNKEYQKAITKFETIEIPEKYDWNTIQSKINSLDKEPYWTIFQIPDGIGLGDVMICPPLTPPWIEPLPPKTKNPCAKIALGDYSITVCVDPEDEDSEPLDGEPGPQPKCGLYQNDDGEFECRGSCSELKPCVGIRMRTPVLGGLEILRCSCTPIIKIKEIFE